MDYLRKKAVPIPCRWIDSEQAKLESIGIDAITKEGTEKIVWFYFISSLYEYVDSTDGIHRTAIYSDGKEYCTDLSAEDVMALFEDEG